MARARRIPPEPTFEEPDSALGTAMVDRLSEGVYFVDPARRIRDWIKGAEGLTGYAAADVVGRFCHVRHLPGYGCLEVQAGGYGAPPGEGRGRIRAEVDAP